jgi:uncharacterized DUF497 family protein
MRFEWDKAKNKINLEKHGVEFDLAKKAFKDKNAFVLEDTSHSESEKRYFCFGVVDGKVMTVRFTKRGDIIRIIGAGFWRKGKKIYDKKNK